MKNIEKNAALQLIQGFDIRWLLISVCRVNPIFNLLDAFVFIERVENPIFFGTCFELLFYISTMIRIENVQFPLDN